MSNTLNPITILRSPADFPDARYPFYELADPGAGMDTTVAYAGIIPFNRDKLAADFVKTALGFFNPYRARWLGGLVYHAMLPESPPPDLAERPDPQMIPLRNELAARYVGSMLRAYMADYVHRPKVTGAETELTLGQTYALLGEGDKAKPWQDPHRQNLAVMLNDPGFNALLIANYMGDRLSEDDCVGDKISIARFIAGLNENSRRPDDIHHDLYENYYGPMKLRFVLEILAWAKAGRSANLGQLSEYYQPPEGHEPYL